VVAIKKFSPQLESDLAAMMGPSARAALRLPPEPRNDAERLELAINRLAALSPTEFAQVRKGEARKLGIRASDLDKFVKEKRGKATAISGQALNLNEPEPWPEPVDGVALLDSLSAAFTRFIVLPSGAAAALALWVVFTHAIDAFDIAPRIAILSAVMGSGKTTLLTVLKCLVPRGLLASNVTPSAVFRLMETAHPTLLIDEADSFAREDEGLRGILNSGHQRDSAFVIRVEGDDHEPRCFSTWGAVAMAAIGKLPGTWLDRSVVVRLKRKSRSEVTERITRDAKNEIGDLALKVARWTLDNMAVLKAANPDIPTSLNDRCADNWRPLLAIANTAGGRGTRSHSPPRLS